jgi:hypothetical protein
LSTLQETGAKFETRKKEHLARDGEVAKTKATIMKYVKSVFVPSALLYMLVVFVVYLPVPPTV